MAVTRRHRQLGSPVTAGRKAREGFCLLCESRSIMVGCQSVPPTWPPAQCDREQMPRPTALPRSPGAAIMGGKAEQKGSRDLAGKPFWLSPPSKLSILTWVPSGKSSRATAQKEPRARFILQHLQEIAMATEAGGKETSTPTFQPTKIPACTRKKP